MPLPKDDATTSGLEEEPEALEDDDDYSPLLDPLAWSVNYEACPRDVCVTHDLRATLCDPDRSVP